MKSTALIILVSLIFNTTGFLIKVPTLPTQPTIAPSGWIHLQKLILPLFENVCEVSTDPVIVRLSQEFNVNTTTGIYLKPEVINNFQKLQNTNGFLSKGVIFSNYDYNHSIQLKTIYEVFVYAKDFDTFYKSAAWARQNLNCGLFTNALYLAILNRRDTQNLAVPAPYELLPNYFIQKDVVLKASALLSGEEIVLSDSVRVEGNSYVLDANYTADIFENDNDSKLAYFHEDIGLNSYYFLQRLKRSPWFNTASEMHINYGEYLYHMMKQMNTRYNLERYTNSLLETEDMNLDELKVAPYNPSLVYSNGKEFGHRTTAIETMEYNDLQLLETIESNIVTIVTHMRDTGYNKTQILNHMMDILVTGERSYETILRKILGKDVYDTNSQPSVLDHYLTSLRDPVFWRINKKIVRLIDEGLKVLPSYTKSELYFPGIEVLNVDVKKIMTSFDYFQFDVTDALKSTTTETTFQVKIGQPRLNHKPFAVKLNISSLVTQKGLVKLYLGPKVAAGELASKRNLFMLLDSFEYNFKQGINVISRSSDDIMDLSGDFTSLRTFRKKISDAEFGLNVVPFGKMETVTGFPSRLILPKGTPEGIPLQIFVYVGPFVKPIFDGMFSIPNVEFNSATLSPGFPLDLDIQDSLLFDLPNAMVKDILITHKADKVMNYGGTGVTKKWQKSTSDDPARPEYGALKKEPFDYSSKKGQFKSQEEYAAKRKQPFDYNAKKLQYDKTGNYETKNSDNPKNIDPVIIENTEKTTIKNSEDFLDDVINKIEMNNEYFYDNQKETTVFATTAAAVDDSQELYIPETKETILSFPEALTRKPSVYNYLIHDYYDNYDENDKVYE